MSSAELLILDVEAAARREGFALDVAQQAVLARVARAVTRALDGQRTRGVYVHGPAGRGKTWLADAVYAAVPPERVARVHFHGFFDELHRLIQTHRRTPDATTQAVDDVLGASRVVVFDELHVHDPADARLLTRLLERLVERGAVLLATSNYAPQDLLPDPVWHHLFEPGIALPRRISTCARWTGRPTIARSPRAVGRAFEPVSGPRPHRPRCRRHLSG